MRDGALSSKITSFLPFTIKNKKVLISPLNWGLGHASRCVPIIKILEAQGAHIILSGGGNSGEFLQGEFPNYTFIYLPTAEITYSKNGMTTLGLLVQIPKIIRQTIAEHKALKQIIASQQIDLIISDNRYGLWNKNTFSVVICHQIAPKVPKTIKLLQPIISYLHQKMLGQFSQCWVPDMADYKDNLAGELSHPANNRLQLLYINPLSHLFQLAENEIKYDILIILSGPEPQRNIIEKEIIHSIKDSSFRIALVRGTNKKTAIPDAKNFTIHQLANSLQLSELISQSQLIICRSGYSSIMDLYCFGKKAIFVPTPGQTEQEYLAKHLLKNEMLKFISQEQIKTHLLDLINENLEVIKRQTSYY